MARERWGLYVVVAVFEDEEEGGRAGFGLVVNGRG